MDFSTTQHHHLEQNETSSQEVPQDATEPTTHEYDSIYTEEQEHLTQTYTKLETIGKTLLAKLTKIEADAADTKRIMADELTSNFATYDDAIETYADIASMNRIIDGYNLAYENECEKLGRVEALLREPYFAKIVFTLTNTSQQTQEPKEFYIGQVGISDENYKRLIVDWRSPLAEVYYNQDNGPTSYVANGRVIPVDLKLRRQFEINGSTLLGYFDTTIAIQDSLLLASLNKHRSAHMQAITSTIQKEQNKAVRHKDVEALLIQGIAGSGKTSVLLQRIAYLFYQNRDTLKPEEVVLLSPNPVFSHYITNVLPDLGEKNPPTFTWEEFVTNHVPTGTVPLDKTSSLADFETLDTALESFTIKDFREIKSQGVRFFTPQQIASIQAKYKHIQSAPHLITLIQEELLHRFENRLKSLATQEDVQEELLALPTNEQVRLFRETITTEDQDTLASHARSYLQDKFAQVRRDIVQNNWVRIERIGTRILQQSALTTEEWLYCKIAVTGLTDPSIKYLMIDEAQDYTQAQLTILARYYKKAHLIFLGDQNQAITPHSSTFEEIAHVAHRERNEVAHCSLMTSYRSTPEITALFAKLANPEERMQITSIQRDAPKPEIIVCPSQELYQERLREAGALLQAESANSLSAIITTTQEQARHLTRFYEQEENASLGNLKHVGPFTLIDEKQMLPDVGVVILPLDLAKGLEFDHVLIADASAINFDTSDLSRRRLYTAISRATRDITILSQGPLSSLLLE